MLMTKPAAIAATILAFVGTAAGPAGASPSGSVGLPARVSTEAALDCTTLGTPPRAPGAYAAKLLSAIYQERKAVATCYANANVVDMMVAELGGTANTWRLIAVHGDEEQLEDQLTYTRADGARISVVVGRPSYGKWHRGFAMWAVDTTGPVGTYGDRLIKAWGRGDKATALKYATRDAVNALWEFSDGAGGPCWWRESVYGAIAFRSVHYRCASQLVTLTIKPAAAAAGRPQAVTAARIESTD